MISLLQPPPQVYDLFDNVILMSGGEFIYQGPREKILEHLAAQGVTCPPETDVADFLLQVASNKSSVSTHVLVEAYKKSQGMQSILATVTDPKKNSDLTRQNMWHMNQVLQFTQGFGESTVHLMRRQFQVIGRNKPFLIGRVAMVLVLGLLYGTTFYQFEPSNVQVVVGVSFSGIMFVCLGQVAQMPLYMAARPIFYKQRRANFFRTISYVLSYSLCNLPLALVESLVFGSLLYWLAGFVNTLSNFVIFEALLFVLNVALGNWFFFISTIAPDLTSAQPLGLVSVLIFVTFAGFIITTDLIPDYYIWLHWIDPMAWALRTLMVNQFTADEFQVCVYQGINYCTLSGKTFGDFSLGLFDFQTDKVWILYGFIYFIVMTFFLLMASCVTLEFIRYDTKRGDVESTTEAENKEEKNEKHITVQIPNEAGVSSSFVPVTLAFQDLWYSVPAPGQKKGEEHESIDLLKGISGVALPGTMTALMGSSGAGKTTLLDVISGRKTGGSIRGEIFLNGYPATSNAVRRCTGYCEQMDIHSDAATIREALTFSAFLRQPATVSHEAKRKTVDECLDLLELHEFADEIVRGLSLEKMKRLTIGVELAAQPSVLFLVRENL